MENTQQATCRHCGRALNGKPYYMGGHAYHPETGKQCPVNHYGGFVCSERCDYEASITQYANMPGSAGATRPDTFARETIRNNWGR